MFLARVAIPYAVGFTATLFAVPEAQFRQAGFWFYEAQIRFLSGKE